MIHTRAAKSGFILDIEKSFSSLRVSFKGGNVGGKFLDAVYRIHLIAPGVSCTKLRMIRR
jgi:hypothetical protein